MRALACQRHRFKKKKKEEKEKNLTKAQKLNCFLLFCANPSTSSTFGQVPFGRTE